MAPNLEAHPLPRLLDEGLFVTISSDDPPMFNTTLTEEYLRIQRYLQFRPGADQDAGAERCACQFAAGEGAEKAAAEFEFVTDFAELDWRLGPSADVGQCAGVNCSDQLD